MRLAQKWSVEFKRKFDIPRLGRPSWRNKSRRLSIASSHQVRYRAVMMRLARISAMMFGSGQRRVGNGVLQSSIMLGGFRAQRSMRVRPGLCLAFVFSRAFP
jgi:hypothetical protein